MTTIHKSVLYIALNFLGGNLLIFGLISAFSPEFEPSTLTMQLEAKNQLRALNGMMAAVGAISLWCCFDLENKRQLVRVLGLILFITGLARTYSLLVDGMPGFLTSIYLVIEFILALLFLLWPPNGVDSSLNTL